MLDDDITTNELQSKTERKVRKIVIHRQRMHYNNIDTQSIDRILHIAKLEVFDLTDLNIS